MIARENPDRLPDLRRALIVEPEPSPKASPRPAAEHAMPAGPMPIPELVPLSRLPRSQHCRELELRLRAGIEALEYFDSLPPEAARRLVAELLEYYGEGIGRWLADAADYVAALAASDRPLGDAIASAAFPSAAQRLRLVAALRELLRTS